MEALGITDPENDIVSGLGDSGISPPFQSLGTGVTEDFESTGDTVDAEIVDEGSATLPPATSVAASGRRDRTRNSGQNPRSGSGSREAKSGPPALDEWTKFFGNVLLRIGTEFYINMAFRGIDEDVLSEREVERLALSEDERDMIAVPFAELANKSKFMRKHGRTIVASGDAFNALVVLGAWASRVNRIAAKYRPRQPQTIRGHVNGSSGQSTPEPESAPTGSLGGRIANGSFTIFPGSG